MKKWMARAALLAVVLSALSIGAAYAVYSSIRGPGDIPGYPRQSIRVDATHTVSYYHAGDPEAPRIIYVHGSPGSATVWSRYITDPIPGYESIALDRFGFGESAPHNSVPSLKEQAMAIKPLLIMRRGKWPILVGHSLGGTIVCEAAADFPRQVGGLVILAGALAPGVETVHWYQRLANLGLVRWLLPHELAVSNREVVPLKGELQDLGPRLKDVVCPIVIVHGEKDSLVPFANVEYMRTHFPAASVRDVIVVPDQDHYLPWTIEPRIREAIEELGGG